MKKCVKCLKIQKKTCLIIITYTLIICYFIDVVALLDEGKTMNTVGKYNDNIVNLQGVCFDREDGWNLKNVSYL